MQLKSGTLLQGGKYKIVRFIKSGGFGCTYEAWHTVFGDRVAIKEFFPKDFCNRDADTHHVTVGTQNKKALVAKLKAKFLDEAVAIHNLSHSGIVKVSDIFEENSTAYYVMDYIDGCSLDDVVRRDGLLSEQNALDYIRQVCSALTYVHSRNRLHLDIKPGNIMVDDSGRAVLIDFGASKQYDEVNGENTSTLLGMTPGYAPLEQYKRGGVQKFDAATDIYALGATLYKLLTGQTPPDAGEVNEDGLPEFPSDVPQYLREAIIKSMQPKKKDRPQSIDDFLALLVEPAVDDDCEDPGLKEGNPEDTELTDEADPSDDNEEDGSGTTSVEPRNKRCLYSFAAGVLASLFVFLCVIWVISNSEKREKVEPNYVVTEHEDLSTSGTANSYIVSKAGNYKFRSVKGNSSISVGTVSSVEVLWESFGTSKTPSVGSLVSKVSYDDGYIQFSTPATFREGNAVIAAKDASGKILWSWHIWLTDSPQGQVYYNNGGTMMDRNLGATSATPGDVGALGLLYQWGRKDPFLGSSSINRNVVAKSTIVWPSPVSSSSSRGTIAYAVEHPTTFITSNYDWYYTGSSTTDNTRWQSRKTIYDPCPVGWRVPDGGSNGVWAEAMGSSSYFDYSYDSTKEGMNFTGRFGSASTIWYPASGSREYDDGGLNYVGSGGYCWSASPYSHNAYYLKFYYDGYVYPSSYSYRADGQSVRCLQE